MIYRDPREARDTHRYRNRVQHSVSSLLPEERLKQVPVQSRAVHPTAQPNGTRTFLLAAGPGPVGGLNSLSKSRRVVLSLCRAPGASWHIASHQKWWGCGDFKPQPVYKALLQKRLRLIWPLQWGFSEQGLPAARQGVTHDRKSEYTNTRSITLKIHPRLSLLHAKLRRALTAGRRSEVCIFTQVRGGGFC